MCEQSFYGIRTVANTLPSSVDNQLMAIFEGIVFEAITAVVSTEFHIRAAMLKGT